MSWDCDKEQIFKVKVQYCIDRRCVVQRIDTRLNFFLFDIKEPPNIAIENNDPFRLRLVWLRCQ